MAMVLVVDDDRVLAQTVASSLESRGWHARVANDCAQARIAITEEVPRLVVLDLNLPDGLGWDLLEELRAGPLPIDVPVIIISSMPVTRSQVRERRVAAYLAKPFGIPNLLETARTLAPPRA
ncbi:MAG: response regulator [Dehalococcoidia bacterium]|nr:response regulator [Dehalococcoidia bacterium]